jgi:hypothetical protein
MQKLILANRTGLHFTQKEAKIRSSLIAGSFGVTVRAVEMCNHFHGPLASVDAFTLV